MTIKKVKKLVGVAIADSKDKTVKVQITLLKEQPIYHKQYQSHRYLLAHTEKEIKKLDKVTIVSSKPISKHKHWQVIE